MNTRVHERTDAAERRHHACASLARAALERCQPPWIDDDVVVDERDELRVDVGERKIARFIRPQVVLGPDESEVVRPGSTLQILGDGSWRSAVDDHEPVWLRRVLENAFQAPTRDAE